MLLKLTEGTPPEGLLLSKVHWRPKSASSFGKASLLPVPTKRTKGVLVFPTVDGHVVAGPTAHDQEDKDDWSVRPEARDEVMEKAIAMWPPLDGAEPVTSYAGLRPAGRFMSFMFGCFPRARVMQRHERMRFQPPREGGQPDAANTDRRG